MIQKDWKKTNFFLTQKHYFCLQFFLFEQLMIVTQFFLVKHSNRKIKFFSVKQSKQIVFNRIVYRVFKIPKVIASTLSVENNFFSQIAKK